MRELTNMELHQVGGGSGGEWVVAVAIPSWAGTVAGAAVGYTLKGAAVGGVAGAAVGLAAGLIVGTGAYLATKDGPEPAASTADE